MSEAFDKFHHWENAHTLLKLVVSERSIGPKIFLVNIAWIDERSLFVCFFDPKTGSYLPPVNFSHAVFYVRQFALEAVRPAGDLLVCEEKADSQRARSMEFF
jgi:hypothetical protein